MNIRELIIEHHKLTKRMNAEISKLEGEEWCVSVHDHYLYPRVAIFAARQNPDRIKSLDLEIVNDTVVHCDNGIDRENHLAELNRILDTEVEDLS